LGPGGEEKGETEAALNDTREMTREELEGRAVSMRVVREMLTAPRLAFEASAVWFGTFGFNGVTGISGRAFDFDEHGLEDAPSTCQPPMFNDSS
jgi:hypothetical protein